MATVYGNKPCTDAAPTVYDGIEFLSMLSTLFLSPNQYGSLMQTYHLPSVAMLKSLI